jgi:hypothetical protein
MGTWVEQKKARKRNNIESLIHVQQKKLKKLKEG